MFEPSMRAIDGGDPAGVNDGFGQDRASLGALNERPFGGAGRRRADATGQAVSRTASRAADGNGCGIISRFAQRSFGPGRQAGFGRFSESAGGPRLRAGSPT
ncbi:hypothetical protein SALB1_3371 [Salinisphaera sp. LB1]|nr:hypothetical protein SALB1_3371 [Salinisphaera sp. LB1]